MRESGSSETRQEHDHRPDSSLPRSTRRATCSSVYDPEETDLLHMRLGPQQKCLASCQREWRKSSGNPSLIVILSKPPLRSEGSGRAARTVAFSDRIIARLARIPANRLASLRPSPRQICCVFHFPRLNKIALAAAIAPSAITIEKNTPFERKCIGIASQ